MLTEMSNALERDNFAVSFMHLKIRRELKEDYMKRGESKVGTELQNDVIPQGWSRFIERVLNTGISQVC